MAESRNHSLIHCGSENRKEGTISMVFGEIKKMETKLNIMKGSKVSV